MNIVSEYVESTYSKTASLFFWAVHCHGNNKFAWSISTIPTTVTTDTKILIKTVFFMYSPYLSEPVRPPGYADYPLYALCPRQNPRLSRLSTAVLLPATSRKVSAFALYNLRGCIASSFRIAALVLHCLRLNFTSRLRLQGCVPTACFALSGPVILRTVLSAPYRRTLFFNYIAI